MAYNEKTRASIEKYLKENTDDIRLRVPKGTKESWKKYAEEQGISMTRFVLETVNEVIRGEVRQWIPINSTL